MIITLNADFSEKNINAYLTSWMISALVDEGATYNGPTSVEKGAALNTTVTIADGYEVATGDATVTMGGTVVEGAATISGNTITINIAEVTGFVSIRVVVTKAEVAPTMYTFAINPTPANATVLLTANGYAQSGNSITVAEGTEVIWSVSADGYTTQNDAHTVTSNYTIDVELVASSGEVVDPETPNTPTEPADVLQLNAFRYDEDVTINSGGDTSTKTGYNTFYEIPVLPSSTYYINGAVRVALLNSSKTYRNDYNIYTDAGSNAGQAGYITTDANTAFLNITVLESKCTIEDAKIQIAQLTATIKDTKTLASTGATLVTGTKLSSGSYSESSDENYIVYKDIPVTAGATYKIAGSARVWFLAEDKTAKSSTNPTTGGVPEKFCFKVPTGAAYASASIYKNNMDKSAEELELHELTVAYSV